MGLLRIVLEIAAPPERCFDLARSVDLHILSTGTTDERAVGGVTHGLLTLDDEVTWSARHFGIRQRLTSRITAFDRPRHFRDSMVRGAFAGFEHDHFFEPTPAGTRMIEVFDYAAPCGFLGRAVERALLDGYMERFLAARASIVRRVAESEEWRRFVAE
jgi:ligand-binding SRPBCC domain-containing protein